MLRKTAESQTISYVLWLATFHCLEAPFCLFLLGFFLASPIASSFPPVMLEWATWGGGVVLPFAWWQLAGCVRGFSVCSTGATRASGRDRSVTFHEGTEIFLFVVLCHPIIESRGEPEKKQKWQSKNKNVKSPCFGLDVIKFPFPYWIQQKPVVTILNWCRNALSPASSLVSSWKWYLGEVTSKTFSMLHSWGTLGLDWHRLAGFVRAQYDMRRTNDSQHFPTALTDAWFHSAWSNRLFPLDISFWGHF